MDMKTSDPSQGTERGASAVEYGLLIAGIAAVVVVAIYALGGSVFGLYDSSCTAIAAQRGATC
jgi:pilus assembly protein Flp/PilA